MRHVGPARGRREAGRKAREECQCGASATQPSPPRGRPVGHETERAGAGAGGWIGSDRIGSEDFGSRTNAGGWSFARFLPPEPRGGWLPVAWTLGLQP